MQKKQSIEIKKLPNGRYSVMKANGFIISAEIDGKRVTEFDYIRYYNGDVAIDITRGEIDLAHAVEVKIGNKFGVIRRGKSKVEFE